MDWKDVLGQLRQDPTLPAGECAGGCIAEDVSDGGSPKKDILRILVDRKGRKGKVATIIEGFTIDDDGVAEVASILKRKLGVGGSSRDGEILIQGDVAKKVADLLRLEGYKVKL